MVDGEKDTEERETESEGRASSRILYNEADPDLRWVQSEVISIKASL